MKHSKSSLFLMELVIAILFFSLASTVCIQLFAKSHKLSARTTDENHAVLQAQNLAECWLATDGDLERMAALFPEGVFSPESACLRLYFDAGWNACTEDSHRYIACITGAPADETGNVTSRIFVRSAGSADEEELYSLSLSHHIRKRRGSYEK